MTRARLARLGPFLWSPRFDLLVFGGSAVVALGLVLARRLLGLGGDVQPWAWLVFVLGIDVAHVYSTLFRTYLDGEELRRHPLRYALAPLVAYGLGVALYAQGYLTFWRVLAYVALFHFVRQQVGWAAVYRAREGAGVLDRVIDSSAIYAATLYPVFLWHLDPSDKPFSWFVDGDFVALPAGADALHPIAAAMFVLVLGVFVARQVLVLLTERRIAVMRVVVVTTTVAIWYLGIVATDSDFDFTVTNVIAHGVPYVALLWSYTVARGRLAADTLVASVASAGIVAFACLLVGLAFFEELLWDRLVFGDRPWLFGSGTGPIDPEWALWVVPLLAAPQATHYLLDGVLWRRADTRENPAQRRALGFEPSP